MDSHRRFPAPTLLSVVLPIFGLVCALSFIYRESSIMRATAAYLASITAFAGHGSFAAAAVDVNYYPPSATQINNLTSALESKGTYGFAFDGSYPAVKYGTYVWGNMPHVRRREYVVPERGYKLKYVELVHRHHKRTVYASNSFPVESYGWNCDDEGLFYYGRPLHPDGNSAAHTYWSQYTPGQGVNPFKPTGFLGSCQFPQITRGGLDDSHQHGKDLYGVYHDLLHLIPDDPKDKVAFRVTQNVITSQVAGMVINGMFGKQKDFPLRIQATGIDSLEPTYTCASASTTYNNERSSAAWRDHLSRASSLYAALDDISGVPPSDSGFHASFDHYFDNLSARQCHGKPLPCKLVNGINSTTCVTQDMANEVYRLGQWEYSYLYRDSSTSLSAAVASYGVWVAELAQHIRDSISGESKVVYFHNVAHDGSISRLLSFLQIDVMVWPGMGAEVVFEIWEKNEHGTDSTANAGSYGAYAVRVLFGGKVLKSSSPTLGLMDMIPLQTVLDYFDGLVGKKAELIVGKCSGGSS